jgi:hypothetical protein
MLKILRRGFWTIVYVLIAVVVTSSVTKENFSEDFTLTVVIFVIVYVVVILSVYDFVKKNRAYNLISKYPELFMQNFLASSRAEAEAEAEAKAEAEKKRIKISPKTFLIFYIILTFFVTALFWIIPNEMIRLVEKEINVPAIFNMSLVMFLIAFTLIMILYNFNPSLFIKIMLYLFVLVFCFYSVGAWALSLANSLNAFNSGANFSDLFVDKFRPSIFICTVIIEIIVAFFINFILYKIGKKRNLATV